MPEELEPLVPLLLPDLPTTEEEEEDVAVAVVVLADRPPTAVSVCGR